MKRLKFLLLFLLALLAGRLYGDIILVGPKPAKICVRINNLNEFPDIALVGLNDCFALSKSNKAYPIQSSDCLNVNKLCPLSLYVMKKDYLNQTDLDEIDWNEDENVQKLNLTVRAKTFNTSRYSSVEIDFNLACQNDSVFYLYKTKMTYKHQNKQLPDAVQFFEDEVTDPLKPISVSTENASN